MIASTRKRRGDTHTDASDQRPQSEDDPKFAFTRSDDLLIGDAEIGGSLPHNPDHHLITGDVDQIDHGTGPDPGVHLFTLAVLIGSVQLYSTGSYVVIAKDAPARIYPDGSNTGTYGNVNDGTGIPNGPDDPNDPNEPGPNPGRFRLANSTNETEGITRKDKPQASSWLNAETQSSDCDSPPTSWMLFFPLFLAPNVSALSAASFNSSTVRPSHG